MAGRKTYIELIVTDNFAKLEKYGNEE